MTSSANTVGTRSLEIVQNLFLLASFNIFEVFEILTWKKKDPTFSTCSVLDLSVYARLQMIHAAAKHLSFYFRTVVWSCLICICSQETLSSARSQWQCVNPCLSHSLPLFVIDSQQYDQNQRPLSPSRLTQLHKQNPGQTEHRSIILYDKLHCCNDWYSASSSNVKLKSVNFVAYVCSHFYGCALQFLFFQNQLVNLPKPCIIILISYTCP